MRIGKSVLGSVWRVLMFEAWALIDPQDQVRAKRYPMSSVLALRQIKGSLMGGIRAEINCLPGTEARASRMRRIRAWLRRAL